MPANLLYYDSSTDKLKQATTAEKDQLADFVLEQMAEGTYAGTITEGSGSNSIGTFTDTARQEGVGSTDTSTVSRNFTLYQRNTRTLSNDPPEYVGLDTATANSVVIKENQTSLNELADDIISRSLNGGPNSYVLSTSAPSDGGTYIDRGAITDSLENFNTVQNDYRLWHKVASGNASSSKRPLKLSTSGTLTAFTDQDLTDIIKVIEDRIINTGIGQYALQTSTPSEGTWVDASTVSDTRRQEDETTYVGNSNFAGNYLGNYVGPNRYVGNTSYFGTTRYWGPTGSYIGGTNYFTTGTFIAPGTTSYLGNYTGNFAGTASYTGAVVGSELETVNDYRLWKRIS